MPRGIRHWYWASSDAPSMAESSQIREGPVRALSDSNPQDARRLLVRNRRDFLRSAAGVTLGSALLSSSWARTVAPAPKRKVVVVTFGGGARDQETFAPEGQENIPHLMRELIPQASFFTQVVNPGILVHYLA